MLASLDAHCHRIRELGLNSALLVDKLRPYTQRVWQNFSLADKRRFLREFRTRWNVVRHRIPEAAHRRLTTVLESGRLEIVKGSVQALAATGDGLTDGLEVKVGDTAGNVRALREGAVLNCTGPTDGYADGRSCLYRNLLCAGWSFLTN